MKVFVVIDGLADLPCAELGSLTPLAAARTPYLDKFASLSRLGLHTALGPELAPESDVAVTALLGYDPHTSYAGRGPLEAYGAGISFKDGDLVLRCNFGTLMDRKLVDRRAGRTLTTAEAQQLASTLKEQVQLEYPFDFVATSEHRGVLVIHGNFSDKISNVDPAYRREGLFGVAQKESQQKVFQARPLDSSSQAQLSAAVVNAFVKETYRVLKEHPVNLSRQKKLLLPANIILPRDAGIALPVFGVKRGWAAVVGMPLEKGLAKSCGMAVLSISYPSFFSWTSASKRLLKTLACEIAAARTYIRRGAYGTYYVHFKPIDVAGHDGNALLKRDLLTLLDRKFFRFLWRRRADLTLLVTGDHATPCSHHAHSADVVPVLFYDGKRTDGLSSFSEQTASAGSLGTLRAQDILSKLDF